MGEIVTFRAFSLRHLVEMKLLNTQFTIVCFDVALSVVTHSFLCTFLYQKLLHEFVVLLQPYVVYQKF